MSLAAPLINITFACLEIAFLNQTLSSPLNPNAHFGLSAKQQKVKLEILHLALFLVLETVIGYLILYCTSSGNCECSLQTDTAEMLTVYFKSSKAV